MLTVDSHTHVIAADRERYPLTPDQRGAVGDWVRARPVSAEELLVEMDGAGVDRALLVQASSAYGHENAYVADSAQRYPDRTSSVCIIDMLAPDAPDTLSYWVEQRAVRGIRLFTTTDPAAPWLDDPRTIPVWERTRSLGVPLLVHTPTRHLARLGKMVQRFPELPVALDHLGQYEETPSMPPDLLALADLPNVYGKFSMHNLYAIKKQGIPLPEYFGPLLERFGAHRLMWGSNYPNTADRPYREMVAFARGVFGFLEASDRDAFFGGTALALWPELRGG